jgi:hypothetical protein
MWTGIIWLKFRTGSGLFGIMWGKYGCHENGVFILSAEL